MKWNKLIQGLFLREFAGGEAVGQIKRAELDGKPPMQRVHIACEHRAELACLGIDAKVYRGTGRRMLERNCPGNGKRSQPRETIGKVAEALAEEDTRRDGIGCIGPTPWAPE